MLWSGKVNKVRKEMERLEERQNYKFNEQREVLEELFKRVNALEHPEVAQREKIEKYERIIKDNGVVDFISSWDGQTLKNKAKEVSEYYYEMAKKYEELYKGGE